MPMNFKVLHKSIVMNFSYSYGLMVECLPFNVNKLMHRSTHVIAISPISINKNHITIKGIPIVHVTLEITKDELHMKSMDLSFG
jgi:hypothetical protein